MIKVRYVALIEVEDYVPDDYAALPIETLDERLRGKWIAGAIAKHVRGVFYDPKINVTTQLADVVKINEFERLSKQEGFKAAEGVSDVRTIT